MQQMFFFNLMNQLIGKNRQINRFIFFKSVVVAVRLGILDQIHAIGTSQSHSWMINIGSLKL